jgi:hypothetical protein
VAALCECGCGEPAPIAKRTYGHIGIRKGEAHRFIRGHGTRVVTPESHANRSAAQRKRMQDPAERAAVSAVHKGKKATAEQRAAMSEARSRERNANWTGGRFPHGAGYVYIHVGVGHPMANPKGYALEHRIVMAKHLGRMLTRDEVVHHKPVVEGGSGRKDDNRLENLTLFASHTDHVRHHTALRRAAAGRLFA